MAHVRAHTVRMLRKMILSLLDNFDTCTDVIKEFAPEHNFAHEPSEKQKEESAE